LLLLRESFQSKDNFVANPLRFRRQYTQEALQELVIEAGFEIIDTSVNDDSEGIPGKEWLNVIARKGS
jgi:hypothetical protein